MKRGKDAKASGGEEGAGGIYYGKVGEHYKGGGKYVDGRANALLNFEVWFFWVKWLFQMEGKRGMFGTNSQQIT